MVKSYWNEDYESVAQLYQYICDERGLGVE
jgi:hypothetical protein